MTTDTQIKRKRGPKSKELIAIELELHDLEASIQVLLKEREIAEAKVIAHKDMFIRLTAILDRITK